ncbi:MULTISPECIES: hypothetical protein [unclassified Pseudomonas]|uniref:hypothetical protein n=1 Tax=unclassified Pseudomonas TaxID=196821 RepID=UPI0024490804|nr:MULTISPECIES: hypothetical protein [unclassified Pseudomonas]MDG9926366.1 hypothetical protein [Pseudomonas sp. GD04045]MDH0037615.1 hypothetical protein [Pseudomonas sp. GD04019]
MTAGLNGTGSQADPWLIETSAHWATVLRDSASTGYYRVTGDVAAGFTSGITQAAARAYKCKVIDGGGYSLVLNVNPQASLAASMAGVMLRNAVLSSFSNSSGSTSTIVPFVNCYFTDCYVRCSLSNFFNAAYFADIREDFVALEAKEFRRVLLTGAVSATSMPSMTSFYAGQSLVTFVHVYGYAGSTQTWYTRLTAKPTLATLDGQASNAFSAAAWYTDETLDAPRPYFAETVSLVLLTKVDGVVKARQLYYEAEGRWTLLGSTDADGALTLDVRIRRWLTFAVFASEDFGLDRLQEGFYFAAGRYYLPPTDTGYIYQAGEAGRALGLGAITFGSSPVTVNGVTFTPSPAYKTVSSPRTTRLTGGAQQFITLDTASGSGGGGPVLEGDPAFLDGVVEEIHPMLGTVQPLANAEVVVVELRADQSYAPMGRALSNLLGEFRVETEVYGGGDVFAFAVDFPGLVWQAGAELGLGARVRPPVNNGYVYEVVVAGTAGSEEPQWWADEGDGTEGYIGTARAKAKPYYQPQAHGPLKMTFVTP